VDVSYSFSILADRALKEPVLNNDQALSAGAAVRLIFMRMPKLFDSVLVLENKQALENVSVELIRLLVLANQNLEPGVRFSQSPEYKEAFEKYQSRKSGQDEGETVEIVIR
jgi:hypothetical protein